MFVGDIEISVDRDHKLDYFGLYACVVIVILVNEFVANGKNCVGNGFYRGIVAVHKVRKIFVAIQKNFKIVRRQIIVTDIPYERRMEMQVYKLHAAGAVVGVNIRNTVVFVGGKDENVAGPYVVASRFCVIHAAAFQNQRYFKFDVFMKSIRFGARTGGRQEHFARRRTCFILQFS